MDARALWPLSQIQSPDHWGFIAGKLGAGPAYPLERPFLLGIRGVAPFASETHELLDAALYNDTFVLFTADGLIPPEVFKGSTHAFQRNSAASPDVNHDGTGDVATIDPGRFIMRPAAGKYPVFTIHTVDGSDKLPCHRDVDHDGIPEAGGYFADSILFHVGYDAPPDSDHKSSIGCHTAPLASMNVLSHAVKGYDGMDYVLTTAARVLTLVAPAANQGSIA